MDLTCTPPACVHHSSSTSSRSRAACEIASGSNSSALGIGRSLISKTICTFISLHHIGPQESAVGQVLVPRRICLARLIRTSIASPMLHRNPAGPQADWSCGYLDPARRSWSRKSRLPDNVSIFDEVVVHKYEVRVKQRPVSPVAKAVRVLASCHSCSGPSHNASSTILSCPAFSRAHLG